MRSTSSAAAAIAGISAAAAPTVDPVTRTVDTRNYQMKIAIELGLWSIAFQASDDIYTLLSKKRPTPAQMVTYYSNLSKILWMSSNSQQHQMFHAACLIKYLSISLNVASQESLLSSIADSAVLAVLCASVADSLAVAASESLATSSEIVTATGETVTVDFVAEKATRLTTLVGCGSVPTAQSLMSDLMAKDVVSMCSENVGKVFNTLTATARETGWMNTKLPTLVEALPENLKQYAPALRRLALVQTTRDMQSMYTCLRFERFAELTNHILPFVESIKLLGQLRRTDQIDVSIDYASKTISFGSSPSASSGIGAIRSALAAVRTAASEVRRSRLVSKSFEFETVEERVQLERKECANRRNATEDRKSALEKDAIRRADELADQLRKAEEERLEADSKARAAEQSRKEYEARKREDQLLRAKALVERMVEFGGPVAAEASAMSDEQLLALGLPKLEAMQKEQFAKERQERISKRRNESRRIEHTARLFRMAENEKINEWSKQVHCEDKEFFAKIAAEKAEEWKLAAEQKQASVKALLPFSDLLGQWRSEKTDEFNHRLAARAEERRQKLAAEKTIKSDETAQEDDESNVAPTSTITRDEFKDMAKSLPNWRDSAQASVAADLDDD